MHYPCKRLISSMAKLPYGSHIGTVKRRRVKMIAISLPFIFSLSLTANVATANDEPPLLLLPPGAKPPILQPTAVKLSSFCPERHWTLQCIDHSACSSATPLPPTPLASAFTGQALDEVRGAIEMTSGVLTWSSEEDFGIENTIVQVTSKFREERSKPSETTVIFIQNPFQKLEEIFQNVERWSSISVKRTLLSDVIVQWSEFLEHWAAVCLDKQIFQYFFYLERMKRFCIVPFS